MLRSLRERFNTNTLIAVFLLVMLFSFAGNETLRFIASRVPGLDEAFPCEWLPAATNLAEHQSLIGRAAATNGQPIQLRIRSSTLPTTPEGLLVIRILVINESVGTLPFIYDEDEVIVGDNGTSGLGIRFNPETNIFRPGLNVRTDTVTYPETRIRILGPQQRCIHRMEFNNAEIPDALRNGRATVTAYYRGVNRGAITASALPNATPIYRDQGLWTGVTTSPEILIPAS
ncbi:MAG: hypothetical protein ACOYL5_18675 [Phototrophicaceae bacterium]|jgi:hypothetical protein